MRVVALPSLINPQVSTLPRERDYRGWVARAISTARLWRRRIRERRALANLTQRELTDFGATSADVYRELNSPFWRSLPPC